MKGKMESSNTMNAHWDGEFSIDNVTESSYE